MQKVIKYVEFTGKLKCRSYLIFFGNQIIGSIADMIATGIRFKFCAGVMMCEFTPAELIRLQKIVGKCYMQIHLSNLKIKSDGNDN